VEIFFTLLFIALALIWALIAISLFVFGILRFIEWEWIGGILFCILGVIYLIITIALAMFIFTVLI
jgi:hypothetical protein